MSTTHHNVDPDAEAQAVDDTILEVEQLALEDVKLADEAQHIAERRDAIRARLLQIHPEPGTIPAGPYTVQVKRGARRLNAGRLEADYPVTQHPELYAPKVDTAAVKHHIAGAVLDAYYDEGRPTVVIQ